MKNLLLLCYLWWCWKWQSCVSGTGALESVRAADLSCTQFFGKCACFRSELYSVLSLFFLQVCIRLFLHINSIPWRTYPEMFTEKFPACCGTRMVVAVFTEDCRLIHINPVHTVMYWCFQDQFYFFPSCPWPHLALRILNYDFTCTC